MRTGWGIAGWGSSSAFPRPGVCSILLSMERSTETLTLTIDDELDRSIRAAVAEGEFETPEQVVGLALREWRETRAIQRDGDAIRPLVEAGIAEGDAMDVDDAFFDDLIDGLRSGNDIAP